MKSFGAGSVSGGWRVLTALACACLGLPVCPADAASERVEGKLPVIPMPVEAVSLSGKPFQLTPATVVICDKATRGSAAPTVDAVRRATDVTLKIDSATRATGNIVLRLDPKLFPNLSGWQRDESYKLTVTASGIEIAATAEHGLLNGAQTLAQ